MPVHAMQKLAFVISWGGLLPPYYKYGVFVICGFEIIISAIAMSLGQKYYELCRILFPISYRIFDDNVEKQMKNFVWTTDEKAVLEWHSTKLLVVWFTSTIAVLLSVLLIIPFFFKFSKKAKKKRWISKETIMRICASVFVIVVLANGGVVFWVYLTCKSEIQLFHNLFNRCVKEEIFITDIETGLNCITDDDKEVYDSSLLCTNAIKRSLIRPDFLELFLLFWVCGHFFVIILFGFANKDFDEDNDGDSF